VSKTKCTYTHQFHNPNVSTAELTVSMCSHKDRAYMLTLGTG